MDEEGAGAGEQRSSGSHAPTPPGRPRRRSAVTAWLLILGSAAIVVGGHDAISATEVNARLFGTLVLGAGIVLIVGAAGLHGERPQGRALATVAALLGVALGALLFFAQVVSDEPDELLALWAGIIVLSAAAFWEIREETPKEERQKGVWSQLPVLKSAISVGVLISAGQFWYTSIYVPTTAPASLTLEPKIESVKPRGHRLAVLGSVTIRNTSGTRVNVLGSSLDVIAETQNEESGPRFEHFQQDTKKFQQETLDTDRSVSAEANADLYLGEPTTARIAHDRMVQDRTYLEPDEVVTVSTLTSIPPHLFSHLYLDATIYIARGRVLGETDDPKIIAMKDRVVYLTEVPEAGWLQRLTRGDRFVRTEYGDNDQHDDVTVSFTPDQKPHPRSDFNQRLKRFYGFNVASARAAVALTK